MSWLTLHTKPNVAESIKKSSLMLYRPFWKLAAEVSSYSALSKTGYLERHSAICVNTDIRSISYLSAMRAKFLFAAHV